MAGGVLRRSGDALSVTLRVPALPKGEPRGLCTDHRSFQASVHCCYVTLRILLWGEFSGPVRLRERHFFVQFVENDEKYFFIPHFPIAFCAIWLYNEQKYCREGLYGRTHSHCFR